MTGTPDLETRVAELEATVAMLTLRLLQRADPAVQPEPDFMTQTQVEPLDGEGITADSGHLTIRLTHEPTGIEVVARDRPEGIAKLRKALTDRARRQYDLQWKARLAEARKAGQETPVKRGSDCPEHGGTLLWLGNGDLMCLEGHFYRIPDPPPPAAPSRRQSRPRSVLQPRVRA